MKLPGSAFLADRASVKDFEKQEASWRELVFYSEGPADWPHLGPIVEVLLNDHGRKISYLCSDAADPGLSHQHPMLRTFNIGAGTARTILFARIDCKQFVMTLPDLGNMWLKKSVHPVHYVYAFHSMNSTHSSYRKGAFDNFDTILCVGPHHAREIRRAEELYGLPAKELIEHGSSKLDTVIAAVADVTPSPPAKGPAEVLVAPTWGESSLIEQPIGQELVDTLVSAGMHTVLRLHPMTSRRLPELADRFRRTYDRGLFRLEEDMSAMDSWLRSDVMISDWSGAAIEYAFGLLKPVVYVDTPPKAMNPEWEEMGLRSFEDLIRSDVGCVVDPSRLVDLPATVARLLADFSSTRSAAAAARSKWIFNVGSSAQAAASYLAASASRGP